MHGSVANGGVKFHQAGFLILLGSTIEHTEIAFFLCGCCFLLHQSDKISFCYNELRYYSTKEIPCGYTF